MKRLFLLFVFIFAMGISSYSQSVRDDEFKITTIEQGNDYEGRVVSTLIESKANSNYARAILYVHGYNDYFFQTELADSVLAHNLSFYAVDLRKYGRSYLPHQLQFEVKDLSEYFADIDSAISFMQRQGAKEIFLMGHSTGGLIVSLYADSRNNNSAIKALILNSPFLDLNKPCFQRNILVPFVTFFRPFIGKMRISQGDDIVYAQSLLKRYYGQWNFDTTLKVVKPLPVTVNWLSAIHKGHNKVRKGLNIPYPILVLHSDKSSYPKEYNEDASKTDIVLNVEHIAKRTPNLGKKVQNKIIINGIHDLALSGIESRKEYYREVFEYINRINKL